MNLFVLAILLALVSLIYATVGQAGGTGFLAVMAMAGFPAAELRPTALALTVVGATYSTWHLIADRAIDWRLLARIGAPSLPAAFAGGCIALDGNIYATVTGALLLFASVMMIVRVPERASASHHWVQTTALGAGAGFLSGVTGIGGGVFLAPVIVGLGWVTPKQSAGLVAPFILGNAVTGLAGTMLASHQSPAPGIAFYAVATLAGAVVGVAIGERFMSQRATRIVLALILAAAAIRLIAGTAA